MKVTKNSEDEVIYCEDVDLLDDEDDDLLDDEDDDQYSDAPETILSGMEYTAALIWSDMFAQSSDRESMPPEMGNTLTPGHVYRHLVTVIFSCGCKLFHFLNRGLKAL
jgi:hypothetical protein